jgi:exodeoxyribonuclease VII small subunit
MAEKIRNTETPTYQQAVEELEKIVEELENVNQVDFDNINEKVKRAAVLLKICKKHLHETDKELEKILEQLAE